MNQALEHSLRQLFRPLLRICYRKGVAFGEITELLKRTYLEVAVAELQANAEKPTTSRLAVVTGLTRKDVGQLRKQADQSVELQSVRHNRMTRVLSGWANDAEFCDAGGQPAVLPRHGEQGSFDALVARYSGDMVARGVLEELQRIGAAQVDDNGCVHSLTETYLASDAGEEQGLAILGSDTALLISTIHHNLGCDQDERRFQRKVSYDNLPEQIIPEFRALAASESYALLVKLNKWLAQHDRDSNPGVEGEGRVHSGVGIYYFEEDVERLGSNDEAK